MPCCIIGFIELGFGGGGCVTLEASGDIERKRTRGAGRYIAREAPERTRGASLSFHTLINIP